MITGRRAIAVVARREIRERLRDRAIIVSTAVSLLILAGIVLLPAALGAGKDPKVKVAAAGAQARQLAEAARAQDDAFGVRLEVRAARDDRAAEQLVRDGDADVAVVQDGRRLVAGKSAEEGAVAALQAASGRLRAIATLRDRGIAPPEASRVLAPPPLVTARIGEDREAAQGLASIALIVLYGQLLTYGIWVANGVVEEKASRVVEIILSAIRPRDLLAGKVLGLGVVGLLQLLVIGAGGLGMSAATGNLDVGGSGVPLALGIALGWFLLGYALYATAYGMAGALVPRQDEVQSATTPLTILIVAVFFLGFTAVQDPGGSLAVVLSLLPPSAPLVMPVRMIAGEAGAPEVLASVALTLMATAALVAVAGRVYANAVLRTGGRVKLATALRGED